MRKQQEAPTSKTAMMRARFPRGPRKGALFELRLALMNANWVPERELRQALTPQQWREYLSRVTPFVPTPSDRRLKFETELRPYLARLRAADCLARRGLDTKAQAAYEIALEALSELLEGNPGLACAFDRPISIGSSHLEIEAQADAVPRLSWSRSQHVHRRLELSSEALRRLRLATVNAAQLALFDPHHS
jgi:hypothetical protein